jgi:ribosomal protein S18 acetylase RimI-like enzyme
MPEYLIRDVKFDDLEELLRIETIAFKGDRLSRRSFLRWIKGQHSLFRVVEQSKGGLAGYGITQLHSGTRIARLYSLAVDPACHGCGLGRRLVNDLERKSVEAERVFMRLEVSQKNPAAIQLYESLGYTVFDEIHDYYEDHSNAWRMQKQIRLPRSISGDRLSMVVQ